MNILAIGAHPDDIELGCGGALLAHRARGDRLTLLVMTTGEQGPQAARSRISEQEDAARILGAELVWGGFPDGAVPADRSAVDVVQAVGTRLRHRRPVHARAPNDSHQDHRATAAASIAAARRLSRIFLYESPTTVAFSPSVFVDISDHLEGKLTALRAHVSQVLKNGLVDLEAIEAQSRYRGFQARIRQAEAFAVDRLLLDLSVPTESTPMDAVLQEAI